MAEKRRPIETDGCTQKQKKQKTNDVKENVKMSNIVLSKSGHTADQDLIEQIESVGLDSSYWVHLFKTEIGVTKKTQLQHLNTVHRDKMKKKTKHDWEASALDRIIPTGNTSIQEEEQSKSTKRSSELSNITKLIETNQDKKGLRESQKQTDDWIANRKSENINTALTPFQANLTTSNVPTTYLTDADVIRSASGGQALKGIYWIQSTIDSQIETKRQVINIVSDIQMKGPSLKTEYTFVDFTSKEKRDNFHSTLRTTSFQLSGAVNMKIYLGLEGKLSKTVSQTSEEQNTETDESTYQSREKNAFIPVKSCTLSLENLRIERNALTELKRIEKAMTKTRFLDILSLCNNFFDEYGSHINVGDLHFGGIYRWTATYTSNFKSNKDFCQKMVEDELNGYVSTCFGSDCAVGVGISGDKKSSDGTDTKRYSESERSKITLNVIPDGGPPDIDDFNEWKKGLVRDNNTWKLIARENMCGLWTILQNHQTDFDDVVNLSKLLECCWNLTTIMRNMNQRDPPECVIVLNLLCETFAKMSSISLSQKIDFSLLFTAEESIQTFFEYIASSNEIDTSKIGSKLKIVLEPLRHNAVHKSPKLMAWVKNELAQYKDFPSVLSLSKIETILQLVRIVRDEFLPQVTSDTHGNKSSRNKYITIEFTQACNKLLRILKENDIQQYVILISFLSRLHFEENTGFQHLLSSSELQTFVSETESDMNTYIHEQNNQKTDIQKQACLVYFILSNMTWDTSCPSAKCFQFCYRCIHSLLADLIKDKIEKAFTKEVFNWSQLKTDLEHIKRGDKGRLVSLPLNTQMVIENNSSGQKTFKVTSEVEEVLEKLTMLDYAPAKLHFQDVVKISNEKPKTSMKKLAWVFLTKIMMRNSTVYEQIEHYLKDVEKENTGDNNDSSDDDEDFLDLKSKSIKESSQIDISPLDIAVSVYSCCSQQLKEGLIAKLHACRLAFPIVLPQENNELLVILLSSLRSILIPLPQSSLKPAIECLCHVVSFVRIGYPGCSKSKIINDMMSTENHNTYLNSNTPLKNNEKRASHGLIEGTYFTPSDDQKKKYNAKCNSVTMVLNLRGDASCFKNQMQIMSKLSSAIFVFTTIEHFQTSQCRQNLLDLNTSGSLIVIFLDAHDNSKLDVKGITDHYLTLVNDKQNTKFALLAVEGKEQRSSDITMDIFKKLKHIWKKDPGMSILQRAQKEKFFIDEEFLFVSDIRHAHTLVSRISDVHVSIKEAIIPLQGKPLNYISICMKKMFKPSEYKTPERKEGIRSEICKCRKQQLEMICNVHPFVIETMSHLISRVDNDTQFEFFVKSLQKYLDHFSMQRISQANTHYRSNKEALNAAMGFESPDKIETLTKDLDKSEFELTDSSLNIDHLLREFGQIYEAVLQDKSVLESDTVELVEKLPIVAAKMLLAGIPFELLNGDIIYVPVTWIKAVLNELKNMTGDKKCIILSAVGTQSSGKSTLFNHMFGLDFPVGHGRVTKGAFLLSVPVDDENLPFKHILVIDTEGLRAPERGHENFMHDNEFATFIMGLADINVININGEVSHDMNEVLQMVVYALLRLKIANSSINILPHCAFVHQNVVLSGKEDEALEYTMDKILTTLNEMTKEAADQVGFSDIQSFSEVLNFDNNHVWYLPNLFSGNPPMTRINPGYSSMVDTIKRTILYDIGNRHQNCFSLSDTILRINDVWKGILTEDFAFNFKNHLEEKAFRHMDAYFHEITRYCERKMFDFVEKQRLTLSKIKDENESSKQVNEIIEHIPVEIEEYHEPLRSDFESFIDKSPYKHMMIKWKQSYILNIDRFINTLAETSKRGIMSIKDEISEAKKCETVIKDCEKKINEIAMTLADQVEHDKLSPDVQKETFEENWTSYLTEYLSRREKDIESPQRIKLAITSVLWQTNVEDVKFFGKLESQETSIGRHLSQLRGSISNNDLQDDKHIHINRSCIAARMKLEKPEVCLAQAVIVTDEIFSKIDSYLAKLEIRKYVDIYMTEILNIVTTKIKSHNEHKDNDHKFKFQKPYKILILSKVTEYCIKFFCDLNEEYFNKHSPMAKLKNYKNTAWQLFLDLVEKTSEDTIAANFFREAIQSCVFEYLSDVITKHVEDEIIIKHFKHTKHEVMISVKRDLVKQNAFDFFSFYIECPDECVKQWLTRYTNEALFTNTEQSPSVYEKLCAPIIENAFDDIEKAVNSATDFVIGKTGTQLSGWIDCFISSTKVVPVLQDKLQHVENRNVTNLDNFRRLIFSQLPEIKKNIFEIVRNTTAQSVEWKHNPYSTIFETLWGCCETCPFCNEPCEQTGINHLNSIRHSCRQHRPQGIGDYALDDGKGPLVTDNCSYLIQTNKAFALNDTNAKYKYRHYRQKFPDWEISINYETSNFWKWYFCQYKDKIAKRNGAIIPNIPDDWERITKQQALESL